MKRIAEQTSKDTIRNQWRTSIQGKPCMCALRGEQPGHSNVRAVLRHCVPNKGMPPLRCLRHLSQRTLQRKQSADADCPRRKV